MRDKGCLYTLVADRTQCGRAGGLLVELCGLSGGRVKDAMQKGAVWLQRGRAKSRRLRRATFLVKEGDRLEMYYDEELLARKPPAPTMVADNGRYSIWNKPAGLLTQGTKYGDHCSLLRLVEKHFDSRRQVYAVHRLDREASGLLLVAHDQSAAAAFSELFRQHQISKVYRVEVLGGMGLPETGGEIDLPLDGKKALSRYKVLSVESAGRSSLLTVELVTGRRHQIRRHLEMIGHPVMGDPRYGQGNKNDTGLRLQAVLLEFTDPFTHKVIRQDLAPLF